jgi:arylsulfatase A-like enzyme
MRVGWSRRVSRFGIAAMLVLGLVSTLVACSRSVTHEPAGSSYDGYDEAGGATYTRMAASAAGVPAYGGDSIARASTPGDAAVNERGMGIVDVAPDAPYGYHGWYAAAFYFPHGTFTGASPSQRGDMEIMRWSGTTGEFGGIEVRDDHRAYLMRGSGDIVTGTIGTGVALEEGCWNWIAVRQKQSTGADSRNEVWLNGQRVVTANGIRNTPRETAVTDVRFGYWSRDVTQDAALRYYVDDATIASASSDLSKPRAPVCGQPGPGAERPNVLVILMDDQRAGTENSRATATSPYLMEATRQRFLTAGEAYDEAFATTPQCCPSRASIFTGRYAHNHTVTDNEFAENLGLTEDSPNQQTTLQHHLRTRVSPAYRTAIFGKYLNGWGTREPPFFDDWAVYGNFRDDNPDTPADELQPHLSRSTATPDVCEAPGQPNYEPSEVCMAERAPSGANVRKPLPPGVYETDFLASKVVDFLAEAEDGGSGEDALPWLMYVTPTVPHSPYTPKAAFPDYRNLPVAPFDDDVPFPSWEADPRDKPRSVRDSPAPVTPEEMANTHDAQLRMLKSADDMVRDIFAELDRRGETNTTLAFFLSDHGFMWGEHGIAGKRQPYRDSVKIPLMAHWPGHSAQVTPGTRDRRLAANIDIAPTVLSVLGVGPPAQSPPMDGVDLFGSTTRSRLLLEGWVKDPLPGYGDLRPLCEGQGYCRPSGYSYIRRYLFDPSTDPPLENRPIFREYYANTDAYQLDNLFGGDGAPGGDDLGFTPPDGIMGEQLERDRRCQGHGPPGSWPPPCP